MATKIEKGMLEMCEGRIKWRNAVRNKRREE